jgi:Zn-dependent peptidase ImmA (M78 family)/transcriptional regulator with XRE-family HTH domain
MPTSMTYGFWSHKKCEKRRHDVTGFLFEIPAIPVNGERIRQARELRMLTQTNLSELLGIDQTMVAHIERGTKQPNEELLQAFSDVLRFPVAFFRQPSPPDFPKGSLLFRARAGLGKKFISQAHVHAQLSFEVASRVAERVTHIPIRIPSSGDPIDAARQVRTLFDSRSGPLLQLLRGVEKLGVLLITLPSSNECDAFAVWAGPERATPVIGIVSNKPIDRQRMNVAHELGHLILHREFVSSSRLLEEQAYTFAAELLMPADSISADLRDEKLSIFRLAQLKAKWLVSMQAIARRARELQIISERQYRYLMQQVSTRGWRTEEPEFAAIPSEKPRALRKMVEIAFGEDQTPQAIAEQLHIPVEFLSEMLSGFAGAPRLKEALPSRSVKGEIIRFKGP